MTQLSSTPESRMWAALAHISALCGLVVPFGCVIGPLVIWLAKRDELPFVDDQAKEALNFNISTLIYGTVIGALMAVSLVLTVVLIGFPLLVMLILAAIALVVAWLVLTIVATVRANEGVVYRYPLTLRLVK